jgi:hypothetical protein
MQAREKGETPMRRRLAQVLTTMALAVFVVAPPAFAGGDGGEEPPPPEKKHCNAGNGNGNEGCDPGNSTLNNRGGDETANPLGVRGGSQDNPGGNNV